MRKDIGELQCGHEFARATCARRHARWKMCPQEVVRLLSAVDEVVAMQIVGEHGIGDKVGRRILCKWK